MFQVRAGNSVWWKAHSEFASIPFVDGEKAQLLDNAGLEGTVEGMTLEPA